MSEEQRDERYQETWRVSVEFLLQALYSSFDKEAWPPAEHFAKAVSSLDLSQEYLDLCDEHIRRMTGTRIPQEGPNTGATDDS